jgi:hypothetical protein
MTGLARDRRVSVASVRAIVKDERGMAVVLGLVALLTLTALVLASLSVSAFEPQIAANLVAATQARYLAEAGVEAAFDGLASTANWSTAIAAATGATCATGAIAPHTTAGSAIPGLTATAGTFTVRVRNDCLGGSGTLARDRTITGLPAEDGGGANADTNDRLLIVSTGTVGTASKTVTVAVRKVPLPPINGALTFPGLEANVDFAGSSLTISGVDTRMGTDVGGTGAPVLGISVGRAANLHAVEDALAGTRQSSVSGRSDTTAGATATGNDAVAYDPSLTSGSVTDFVHALRAAADITISSTPATPFSIHGIGASCAGNVSSPTCWGTPAHPKIVYVKGDGSGRDNAVAVSGTSTGTGILVVEDGTLDITGTFRWNGPVIVTGRRVKVRFHGGGSEERAIWGAVVINETTASSTTPVEAAVSGSATTSYSTEAIATVLDGLGGRRFMSLYSWQEH